jgi:hypothetical protein
MPRCGTNFLENQLRLYPGCSAPGPVWEDFLISNSSILKKYTKNIGRCWDSYWFRNTNQDYISLLERSMGKGLETFLLHQLSENDSSEYLITKTPTVKGIENFSKYFKGIKLIIIIRDGRSVVESGQKSFDWNFEKAVIDWRSNAKKIIEFMDNNPDESLLIKYEDLCSNPEDVIREICEYLEIDFNKFPLRELNNLPISGSSELRGNEGGIHWQAVKKDSKFKPLQRFSNWSPWKHKLYNYIAGKEMKRLGYHIEEKHSFYDHFIIPFYLLLWPLKSIPVVLYFALRYRKLIIKTN